MNVRFHPGKNQTTTPNPVVRIMARMAELTGTGMSEETARRTMERTDPDLIEYSKRCWLDGVHTLRPVF